ncbi:MAG: MerR family transcriptional regulator [Bacteroidetes bacterium]|nr:MerR family transcriptional regulator [Bacteroidota bacterium]
MHQPHHSDDPTAGQMMFYSIGEAADILGVSIPTIRMYEREGLIIPNRRRSKHRRFSEGDLERIRCMRAMINTEKVSIAGIRRLLALIPCWSIRGCPPEARGTCGAFRQNDAPCWVASKKSWECKATECRVCRVYTDTADCSRLKETIAACTLAAGTPSVKLRSG